MVENLILIEIQKIRLNQIEINGHLNNSEPILGANSSIQIKNNKLKGLMR